MVGDWFNEIVAESMDVIKEKVKGFKEGYGRAEVRAGVRALLSEQIMRSCERGYYEDEGLVGCKAGEGEWGRKLDSVSAGLTRSGVGRASTQMVADVLLGYMQEIVDAEPWVHHPAARKTVMDITRGLIDSRFDLTVDQVENTIKPYKIEVECSVGEWKDGVGSASRALEERIKRNSGEEREIRRDVGRRRMRQALSWIERKEKNGGEPPFTEDVLDKARIVRRLGIESGKLGLRLSAVKSRACRTEKGRDCCPEVYLHMLGDKLSGTAAMFVDVEMLSEFYGDVVREVEGVLYYGVRGDEVRKFARENERVGKWLDGIERVGVLKDVLQKLDEIRRGD
jgi:hypothetical protein